MTTQAWFVLLAASSVILGVAQGGGLPEYFLDIIDCEPSPCDLDGGLKLCDEAAEDMRVESNGAEVNFKWHPGSTAPGRPLTVFFRYSASEQHTVVFDANADEIVTGGGLPSHNYSYDFSSTEYSILIIHFHKLRVYVNDWTTPLFEFDLSSSEQAILNPVVLRGTDDGTCHRFSEVSELSWNWNCASGICQVDEGLGLCSSESHLTLGDSVGDGTYFIRWHPQSGGSFLKIAFRDGQTLNKHVVVLDRTNDQIRFEKGLSGFPVSYDIQEQEYSIRIEHTTSSLGGTVKVWLDNETLPDAIASYGTGEEADALAFTVMNNSGCQSFFSLDIPG